MADADFDRFIASIRALCIEADRERAVLPFTEGDARRSTKNRIGYLLRQIRREGQAFADRVEAERGRVVADGFRDLVKDFLINLHNVKGEP